MEVPTPLSIKEAIAGLGNSDQPLLSSRLSDLSHLDSEGLSFLEQVWAGIEPERRQQIVSRLVELAEDNFEFNFDSILCSCLRDRDAEVRCKAIEGLWESEETFLINPLIDLLEQDSSAKVQAAAAIALGKFALLAEHEKLRSCHASKVSQALLAAVGDRGKPLAVRRRALEAAAPLSLPQVKKAIGEAYQNSNNELRISAIHAMGKSCDSSWLSVLLAELASTDAEMRYEAAGACGELGEEGAVPHLVKLIGDPDIEVRLAAVQALGKIGGSQAEECLERCLDDSSQALSQMAEKALNELKALENPFSFPF
jgi:HEAT repeat protein